MQALSSKIDGVELRLLEANDKTYGSINTATKNMFNEHSVQLSSYLSRLESLEKFYEKLSSRFGSLDNTVQKLKNESENHSSKISMNTDAIDTLKTLLSLRVDWDQLIIDVKLLKDIIEKNEGGSKTSKIIIG